jgi:hypothetical protein
VEKVKGSEYFPNALYMQMRSESYVVCMHGIECNVWYRPWRDRKIVYMCIFGSTCIAELLSVDPGLDDLRGICHRAVLDLVNVLSVVNLHGGNQR